MCVAVTNPWPGRSPAGSGSSASRTAHCMMAGWLFRPVFPTLPGPRPSPTYPEFCLQVDRRPRNLERSSHPLNWSNLARTWTLFCRGRNLPRLTPTLEFPSCTRLQQPPGPSCCSRLVWDSWFLPSWGFGPGTELQFPHL
ncbi:hypothetical protein HJG60_009675 [Phyllostomus discolor]|uniref:Uncharacterized protein n=1 Tax=Phyllostomus discolor TaxID=89673 RepID=A0A834B6I7_9CHIR|nr:hypothetical protein HJG60_009675 [Phyllostomus discolor]